MAPRGQKPRPWGVIIPCTIFVVCLVLIPIFSLSAVRTWISISFQSVASNICSYSEQKSLNSEVTSDKVYSDTTHVFGGSKNSVLESLAPEDDEAWVRAVMPSKASFLSVQHNETYRVGYGMSMFHGLHCLQILRSALQDAQGLKQPQDETSQDHSHHADDSRHLGHCIQYIAEALMCAADGTLEPPRLWRDEAGNVMSSSVDGQGVRHSCKNNNILWDVATASMETPVTDLNWEPGLTVQKAFGENRVNTRVKQ